jgi:TRAP-type C4-dicarboxylate transport system permease small subunit
MIRMGTFLAGYKKWMDMLARVESAISMACMAFIILINGLGIFTRYFLNRPILWVHEVTILTGTWLFYVGIGLLFTRKEDITLEIVVRRLSEKARRITELVVNGAILIFLIILIIFTYKLIPFVSMSGSTLSFSLGIADVYYYVPVGVGAVLIFIPVLYKTLQGVETLKERAS